MSSPNSLESVTPALSIQPLNFAAKDPGAGGWQPLLDQARAAAAAGGKFIVPMPELKVL